MYMYTDPGNDDRYVNYVNDIDISLFESMIRSLAHGRLELHRDFPKVCQEDSYIYIHDGYECYMCTN